MAHRIDNLFKKKAYQTDTQATVSETKIIQPNISAMRVGKVKSQIIFNDLSAIFEVVFTFLFSFYAFCFFYEKHFCGFLIQPGWFWIVLEVS